MTKVNADLTLMFYTGSTAKKHPALCKAGAASSHKGRDQLETILPHLRTATSDGGGE